MRSIAPWKLENGRIYSADGKLIAVAADRTVPWFADTTESEANTQLMTAAPEMLAALTATRAYLKVNSNDVHLIAMVTDAMKAAGWRGGSTS